MKETNLKITYQKDMSKTPDYIIAFAGTIRGFYGKGFYSEEEQKELLNIAFGNWLDALKFKVRNTTYKGDVIFRKVVGNEFHVYNQLGYESLQLIISFDNSINI